MNEHPRHAEAHIDSIVKQEEEELGRRSASERLADRIGAFAGSLPFVVLHLVLVTAWLLVNSRQIAGVKPFDPWPFSLLGVIVAVEALQMVRAICGRMGLQGIVEDKDVRELSKNTSIESLSKTLEDRLPDRLGVAVACALRVCRDSGATPQRATPTKVN